jgi:hypothetical protein
MTFTGNLTMFRSDALASGRFFFHLVLNGEVIRDEQGVMLSTEDGVLLCAARALEELRQEGFFASGGWQGGQIEVADSAGQTILSFPLGDPDLLH